MRFRGDSLVATWRPSIFVFFARLPWSSSFWQMLIQVVSATLGLMMPLAPVNEVRQVQAPMLAQARDCSSPIFPSSVLIADFNAFDDLDDLAVKQSLEDAKVAAQVHFLPPSE